MDKEDDIAVTIEENKAKKKIVAQKVKERHEQQNKQRPKHVLEMEERAKLRAKKRQDLQKLYEEKKKVQDEQEEEALRQKEQESQMKLFEEKEKKR